MDHANKLPVSWNIIGYDFYHKMKLTTVKGIRIVSYLQGYK